MQPNTEVIREEPDVTCAQCGATGHGCVCVVYEDSTGGDVVELCDDCAPKS